MTDCIIIKGARENNLKNVTLSIPKNKLVVMTGLSGSGKSTLAFDTLQRECQRQYMESMGMVTDLLSKPRVDSIAGLSPSISVDQHSANHNPRSTVGTVTEVYTYLRVLFAKLGLRPCPACGGTVEPLFIQDGNGEIDLLAEDAGDLEPEPAGSAVAGRADPEDASAIACPRCGAFLPALSMAAFSFNKPEGACPGCMDLGVVSRPDLDAILDEERSILDGGVRAWDRGLAEFYAGALRIAGEYYGFTFDAGLPIKEYGAELRALLLHGVNAPEFRQHYPGKEPPTNAFKGRFEGIITGMLRRYAEAKDEGSREKIARYLIQETCPDCGGARLRAESRRVTVAGRTIIELSRIPLRDLATWLRDLPGNVPPAGMAVVRPILDDLAGRIGRLIDVGAGYLSMERPAASLSGGEAQRLRLAALLGSGLTGVLYVLDEPTTGLHPRDTGRLIAVLKRLRDLGNTVLVIEHDLDMMRAADYIIDIGPGAGMAGGRVVAAGTPAEVARCNESITGRYLAGLETAPTPARRAGLGGRLVIAGAAEHNLKGVTVSIPLGTLTALTGVSGSGKSTLLFEILDRAARRRFFGAGEPPGKHEAITGWEHLGKVVAIDQTPISRIPRSNAVTYTDAFTAIRGVFAGLPEARRRKLQARHFSFNVPGGRCERCQGAGVLAVKMHFLPEVQVRCPVCQGRRFKPEVLAVTYRGYNIADVLQMTIEEARALFADVGEAASRLGLLAEVGLGYLQLGQPATTLSGGEAQRIKLAKELARKGKGHTLYLLDEPTCGLHPHDVKRLLAVLRRLVDAGNTVAVIEHNLDVIRAADYLIDFGPEGGDAGGYIIAEGTPEQVAAVEESWTGASLRRVAG